MTQKDSPTKWVSKQAVCDLPSVFTHQPLPLAQAQVFEEGAFSLLALKFSFVLSAAVLVLSAAVLVLSAAVLVLSAAVLVLDFDRR